MDTAVDCGRYGRAATGRPAGAHPPEREHCRVVVQVQEGNLAVPFPKDKEKLEGEWREATVFLRERGTVWAKHARCLSAPPYRVEELKALAKVEPPDGLCHLKTRVGRGERGAPFRLRTTTGREAG